MPEIQKHTPGSFCWFELATTDQDAAKQFYGSLFRWDAQDSPMGPDSFYTMFSLAGRHTGAAYSLNKEMLDRGIPPHWMVYIAVDNADDTARRAKELGAKVIAEPFDVFTFGRMAVLQDPTGAHFSIWQPKQHPGTGIRGVDGTACWVDHQSTDPAKAADFYRALFGWTIQAGEHDPSGYLHIQNGKEFIGGIPPVMENTKQAPPHWLIYFETSDCDTSAKKAEQMGASLYLPPMTIPNVGRMSVIADRQRAVFAVFQDKSKL